MTKPLLVVFIGFPGSGKTYFANRLAAKLGAVTLNSDALRLSMFGSHDAIEEIRINNRIRLYEDVFGAMDYAARQTLLAGYPVVYDAQQSKRTDRRNIGKLAQESNAIAILVWVRTNRAVALARGQEREARDDSHQYTAEKMEYLIDRFDSITDPPGPGENTIEISGEISFEEQYASFQEQLGQIIK